MTTDLEPRVAFALIMGAVIMGIVPFPLMVK
jgi:hypothetical protein